MAFKCMFPGAKYLAGEQSEQVCNENSENVNAVLERMTCTVGVAAALEVAGTLGISWAILTAILLQKSFSPACASEASASV